MDGKVYRDPPKATIRTVPAQPARNISHCGECPNYRSGTHKPYCLQKTTGGPVYAFDIIPSWCPLEVAQ